MTSPRSRSRYKTKRNKKWRRLPSGVTYEMPTPKEPDKHHRSNAMDHATTRAQERLGFSLSPEHNETLSKMIRDQQYMERSGRSLHEIECGGFSFTAVFDHDLRCIVTVWQEEEEDVQQG